jgi:hypothetical protein
VEIQPSEGRDGERKPRNQESSHYRIYVKEVELGTGKRMAFKYQVHSVFPSQTGAHRAFALERFFFGLLALC